jgi:hypothetical protein
MRVLSSLVAARVRPSGANATANTASLWPVNGFPSRRGRPGSVRSHRTTVRPSPPTAMVRPSGANAIAYTSPASPATGLVAIRHIPQNDGAIKAGGSQGAPVRGELRQLYRAGMAGQPLPQWLLGMVTITHVPPCNGSVIAGGGQGASIRGISDGRHLAGVRPESSKTGGRGKGLPKACPALLTTVKIRCGNAELKGAPGVAVAYSVSLSGHSACDGGMLCALCGK